MPPPRVAAVMEYAVRAEHPSWPVAQMWSDDLAAVEAWRASLAAAMDSQRRADERARAMSARALEATR